MTAPARAKVAAFVVLACHGLASPAHAQPPPMNEGRSLDEALAELQRGGLKVIYSSAVVYPSMRVTEEPRPSSPRRVLDALLEPHGLIAQDGPRGTLLVVKNPRARLSKRVGPGRDAARLPPGSGVAAPRYEETVQVADELAADVVTGTTVLSLRPFDVREVAGGFENVFRTLTTLPGVNGTDELGSRITVRGGAPDQNLTVMDGIEIHNPFRLMMPSEDLALVGLASAFNPDTVQRVEFFPGPFDVTHGDRLSSLLVVKSRDGSPSEAFQGASTVGLGEASLAMEGKLPGGSDGSWLVSARRTYLGLVAERVTSTALPTFTDLQTRATWTSRPGRRLSLVALFGRERLRQGTNAPLDAGSRASTKDSVLGLTFESSLGRHGFSRTVASYSGFTDDLEAWENSYDNSRGANNLDSIRTGGLLLFRLNRRVQVDDLALRQDMMFVPSAGHSFHFGAEAHHLDTGWAWSISGDRSLQQANGSSIRLGAGLPAQLDSTRRVTRGGAWIKDRWRIAPRFVLEPGARLEHSTITHDPTVSPRLGATVRLGKTWRLDGAIGKHAQTPGYEKMLQSDYFVDLSAQASRHLAAERAWQTVLGVQTSLAGELTARVSAYYKDYRDLIVGRLETEPERLARLGSYDVPAPLWPHVQTGPLITTRPVNAGRGRAYGVEAHVSRTGGPGTAVSGWATYSLGHARRTEYGFTRPFDYDRRHSITAAVTARLGPRLEISVAGRAASGLPRTAARGVHLSLGEDAVDADGDGNRAEFLPLRDPSGAPVFQPDYGDIANLSRARLPRFARVDARLTYRPPWGGERWAFHADVVNLFNARNITQIDSMLAVDPGGEKPLLIEVAQDRGIPLFASVGLRFWF